jgi:uroporphyrin-III C-methyltransferase
MTPPDDSRSRPTPQAVTPQACGRTPTVWLVGAGPGDPELLTLKAVRLIGQADVLLVDDLVDRRVLEHARPGARIVEVGKRAGCPSAPQAFIERLLVREALAGHRVVRLKGGDPMVFGRAAEEIDALRAAGLVVGVVPGISAALGAAASMNLSLTDRRAAQGVAFVTGHVRPGGREPDWAALARSGLTLVVYMGLRRAAAVAQALLDGGLPSATPAVVVRRATLPGESRQPTTLRGLADGDVGDATAEPGLLVIGDVVAALQALPRPTAQQHFQPRGARAPSASAPAAVASQTTRPPTSVRVQRTVGSASTGSVVGSADSTAMSAA